VDEVICIYICFVKMSYFYLLAGYVLFHFLTPVRAKNCILQSCKAPFNIFPKRQFSVIFPNQNHLRIFLSPIHVTCLAYQIFLKLNV